MLKKSIIKISDLKFYKGVSEIDTEACDSLLKKIKSLGLTSAVVFKGITYFGIHHDNLIMNLTLFKASVMYNYKDYIVLEDNKFFFHKQDDFEDSEALLLSCLQDLYHYGIGLFSIMAEFKKYYPEYKGEFGVLEYSFLSIWLNILPAMDEIIILLTEKNSKFFFEGLCNFMRNMGHFTVFFLNPVSPRDEMFQATLFMKSSKKALINQVILDSLTYKEEFKNLLYSGLHTKLEYKFRIKNFTVNDAISLFVIEAFQDLDNLRKLAQEHEKQKVSPFFSMLSSLINK